MHSKNKCAKKQHKSLTTVLLFSQDVCDLSLDDADGSNPLLSGY